LDNFWQDKSLIEIQKWYLRDIKYHYDIMHAFLQRYHVERSEHWMPISVEKLLQFCYKKAKFGLNGQERMVRKMPISGFERKISLIVIEPMVSTIVTQVV
jgi:hypothetical protein